jgi:heat shock protein HslJ
VRLQALILGIATAMLAGAGGAPAASSPRLTGQTWQLARLAGINRQSAGITAAFATGGRVSGFSGCNSYSGSYTTSGDSIAVSKNLAVTMMACSKMVMLTERAFLAALTSARAYSVKNDTLTLMGRRNLKLATFNVQSQSLAGTTWTITGYNNGKQAVVSVTAATKLTAAFDKSNVSGSAGCNNYNGTYATTPPRISFGPLASTRKYCSTPSGVMDQEAAYLAALATAATYQLQGSTLELRTAGGAIAVTMQRA